MGRIFKKFNVDSEIFKKLKTINTHAFVNFIANFIFFKGDFGTLEKIEDSSFKNVNTVYFYKNSETFLNKEDPKLNLCSYSSLQEIEPNAFKSCKKLEMYLKCPKLSFIGEGAFSNISNLKLVLELNNFNFITNKKNIEFLNIFNGSSGTVDIINNNYDNNNDTIKWKDIFENENTNKNNLINLKFKICYKGSKCNPNFNIENEKVNYYYDYETDTDNKKYNIDYTINNCGTCNEESTFKVI